MRLERGVTHDRGLSSPGYAYAFSGGYGDLAALQEMLARP